MLGRRDLIKAGVAASGVALLDSPLFAALPSEAVRIDVRKDIGPLDHIWSRCAGSDRADITLREGWRRDLDRFRNEAGMERVRFHSILSDELGVFEYGAKEPNFQNVDAVYDGLLDRGVQPFVELSFMPRRLSSADRKFGRYGANTSPPKDMSKWQDFIGLFVRHLEGRYGASQVRQWYFEVWNEPNLPFFWSGDQAQYFSFYKATAAAVKAVDPALRVGGPSTSAVQWIDAFLEYCSANQAPVDFVSTHLYAGDDQKGLFGQADKYRQNDVIPAAMAMVREKIDATRFKGAELWLSEWSSDSPAMIAHILSHCLPYCHAMSQWALSSVYEEVGVANYVLKEGDNGWGMMAQRGIPKPQFNTYKLLHRLGKRRLKATGPALASRTDKGVAALVWNLAEVQQPAGIPGAGNVRSVSGSAKRMEIALDGAHAGQSVSVSYVDMARGSPFPKWRSLGSPQYPNKREIAEIRSAAEIAPPERRRLSAIRTLTLELPPEGIALIEL